MESIKEPPRLVVNDRHASTPKKRNVREWTLSAAISARFKGRPNRKLTAYPVRKLCMSWAQDLGAENLDSLCKKAMKTASGARRITAQMPELNTFFWTKTSSPGILTDL